MGMFDDLKKKADDLAEDHGDKIKQGIDKAADAAEAKLGPEHADKIDKAAAKAHDTVDDMARKEPGEA